MKCPITRPMLADNESVLDFSLVKYPVLASPKLDGIRALMVDGRLLSRSFKPIPNDYIRKTLEKVLPNGIDGELLIGDVAPGKTFAEYTDGIMRKDGEPLFTFHAFDLVRSLETPFSVRYADLLSWSNSAGTKCTQGALPVVEIVPHIEIQTSEELEAFEQVVLGAGYEGAMIRDPDGPYKCGRATFKQGWLLKVKRFLDAEARVIGVEEQMHNENAAYVDEVGRTKRSSAKAGKVPAGRLGKLVCVGINGRFEGVEFRLGNGPGLDYETRDRLWKARKSLPGKIVKYKYQASGADEAPRILQFLGFRDECDL
jgi:DNA ligase 1